MKNIYLCLSFLASFIVGGALFAQNKASNVVEGLVVFSLSESAEAKVMADNPDFKDIEAVDGKITTPISSINDLLNSYEVEKFARVYPYDAKFDARHRKAGLHLFYYVVFNKDKSPFDLAAELRKDPNITYASHRSKIKELSFTNRLKAPQKQVETKAVSVVSPHHKEYSEADIPNDPDFGKQWNFYNKGQGGGYPGVDIGLLQAREYLKENNITAKNKVGVAVFDGGFNVNHEDLKDNLWTDATYNASTKTSVFPMFGSEHGFCFGHAHSAGFVVLHNEIHMDAHGTHVAGVIASSSDNGKGGVGIGTILGDNPIELFSAKIISEQGIAFVGTPYRYLTDYTDVVIAQNSWAYSNPEEFQPEDRAGIQYFIENAGKNNPNTPMSGGLVIFAASNENEDAIYYPSAFEEVLSVAAVTNKGKRAAYSNYASWVDISAPGGELYVDITRDIEGIWSTSYNDKQTTNNAYYEHMQGTSMACPHVSGVAALILAVYGHPDYTPEELKTRLIESAVSLDNLDPDYKGKMGSGLVNAYYALKNEKPAPFTLSGEEGGGDEGGDTPGGSEENPGGGDEGGDTPGGGEENPDKPDHPENPGEQDTTENPGGGDTPGEETGDGDEVEVKMSISTNSLKFGVKDTSVQEIIVNISPDTVTWYYEIQDSELLKIEKSEAGILVSLADGIENVDASTSIRFFYGENKTADSLVCDILIEAKPSSSAEVLKQNTRARIYPNPSSSIVNVQNIGENADLRLLNARGSLCFAMVASGSLQIDMSGYPSGVYVLQIDGVAYKIVRR